MVSKDLKAFALACSSLLLGAAMPVAPIHGASPNEKQVQTAPSVAVGYQIPATGQEVARRRLVGTWRMVPWAERDSASPPREGTIEFREDGTVRFHHPEVGECGVGAYEWRLDGSRSPAWFDMRACTLPGADAPPSAWGLVEWLDENTAAFQLTVYDWQGKRPTQFAQIKGGEYFSEQKQLLRRVPTGETRGATGPTRGASERVVYRTPWGAAPTAGRSLWKPPFGEYSHLVVDPEDAESVAYSPTEAYCDECGFVWRMPSGKVFKRAVGPREREGANGVRLAPVGFLHGRPVVVAKPAWFGLENVPKGVTDWRTIGHFNADGVFFVLPTGIPVDANNRIDRSRLVRSVGGRPNGVAGIYALTVRSFDGETSRLRVASYLADGKGGMDVLEGPLAGLDLDEVAYFDAARQRLVLVGGEAWDVARGSKAGAITGPGPRFWVEPMGAFYTLEAKPGETRPWGLVHEGSGAIISSGKRGGSLILSRLELDKDLTARKVEVARAVVPLEGTLSRTGEEQARQAVVGGQLHPPMLIFEGAGTTSSVWTAVPSPSGLVLFAGHVANHPVAVPGYPEQVGVLGLWLIVDPRRPAEPYLIPLAGNTEIPTEQFFPVMLGTFPATPGGDVLGIQIMTVGPWSRPVFGSVAWDPDNDGWPDSPRYWFEAFALDRATGRTGPIPQASWRAGANP